MATRRKKKRTRKKVRKSSRTLMLQSLAMRAKNLRMTVPEFKKYVKEAGGMPNPGKSTYRRSYTDGFD